MSRVDDDEMVLPWWMSEPVSDDDDEKQPPIQGLEPGLLNADFVFAANARAYALPAFFLRTTLVCCWPGLGARLLRTRFSREGPGVILMCVQMFGKPSSHFSRRNSKLEVYVPLCNFPLSATASYLPDQQLPSKGILLRGTGGQ